MFYQQAAPGPCCPFPTPERQPKQQPQPLVLQCPSSLLNANTSLQPLRPAWLMGFYSRNKETGRLNAAQAQRVHVS